MRELRNEEMRLEKQMSVLAIITLLMAPLAITAQQTAPADKQASGADVTVISPAALPIARLLPDSLVGIKATIATKQFLRENLSGLVADKAPIYQEYLVTSAASREYAGMQVELFETQSQFAAFGLFAFNAGAGKSKPIEGLGSGGARLEGGVVFWKGNFFIRVSDTRRKAGRGSSPVCDALARAVADAIVPKSPAAQPPLLGSLPVSSMTADSERYFLGPEALSGYVEHGREMIEFNGDTEAVLGEYLREASSNAAASAQTSIAPGSVARSGSGISASPMKLLIVEYHTPQFATDAMEHITGFVSSLPESEQQHIIVKRTGNYIIEAVNVRDREFAEGLINSVQYPYTVKWLRNPLWPTNDPFRTRKAAEMLLSTFGLLGLIIVTVLTVGTLFGTTIFLKRRKRQREIFSDAGGMLRLNIDPFESVVLGLPPKRSEK